MAFIGDYMRGVSGDTGMPSITGLQQYIQQGFDAGRAQGQNQQLAHLSQAAFNDTGDQQQQDVSRAIGIDPKFGYSLAGQVGAQSAAERQTATLQKLGKVASAIVSAKQRGDETTAEGLYQAALPDLRLFASQRGATPPPTSVDGSDMGAMYKLAVMYGNGMPAQEKPISVSPDTTLIDPNTHKVIYQGQGDAGSAVTGMTYNGMPVFRDKMGNLKDVRGNPIPQGAQGVPAGAGVAPAGLPAETQAYVPKVTAALGGAQPFDQFGQPTPKLLDAVQQVESGGNPNAVSRAGAQGAYQFMPATAASVGVNNPFDPQQARQGAAKYLAQLYQQFGGDANKAIAAYNAGPGRVAQDTGAQPQAQATGLQYTPSGNNSDMIAQRAKQISELKARGVQMTPEDEQQYLMTGKASSFQGNSTATLFGDPSLSGSQYVASIPTGNQEIVKGLLNGTVALPTGTTLKSPLWQSALASVKHADPSWNQAAYKQYADTRKFFTVGQGGQLINSINTAAQHLDKLREDIDALNNGNIRPLAYLENQASSAMGGQAPTNFVADLTPVASELAAVYKGKGVPSDEEIRHFRDALTPNMSHGQQLNVIRGWIDLLAGKLDATRNQYQQSMTKLSDPLSVINPRAQEALQRITSLANSVSTTGDHPMPAMSTTPINAPGGQVSPSGIPAAAIQMLQSNPSLAPQFDAKYGAGSSKSVLGG